MTRVATYVLIGLLCVAMAAGVFLGPGPQQREEAPAQGPAVAKLTADDEARLEQRREVFRGLLGQETPLETADGKLAAIESVLGAERAKPLTTWERQAIGAVFGDVLVQDLGLTWVMLSDGGRSRLALIVPGTDAVLSPLELFTGEPVDPREAFEALKARIAELKGG